MGKAAQSEHQPPAGHSSAASVHSLHLLDNDDTDGDQLLSIDGDSDIEDEDDDSPPSYDAVVSDRRGPNASSSRGNPSNARTNATSARLQVYRSHIINGDYGVPGGQRRGTRMATLKPIFSQSEHELCDLIARQARLPPRPRLHITGSHTESTKSKQDKNASTDVIDFDFSIDLTETLLSGWEEVDERNRSWEQPHNLKWHKVRVAEDCDGIKTYRGSRTKVLSWKEPKKSKNIVPDVENQAPEIDNPEQSLLGDTEYNGHAYQENSTLAYKSILLEWCTRYCNDVSPVRSFVLKREVHNFEAEPMIDCLKSHIRETNYRGKLTMSPVLMDDKLTIYSPHWINKLRNNKFIWWACIILQLWIITWPIIWFMEKRYEVIVSIWYTSHRVIEDASDVEGSARTKKYPRDRDERGLANFWAPVVKQSAWARRQNNELISVEDAQRVEGLTTHQILSGPLNDSAAEIERRQRVQRGEGTFTDSVIGFARGLSEVRDGWNRNMGWGENT